MAKDKAGTGTNFMHCPFCGRRRLELEGYWMDSMTICNNPDHFPVWYCNVCREYRMTWWCPKCVEETKGSATQEGSRDEE